MLSKKLRMKSNNQFNYIFKKGKTLKNNKLLIFYSQNKTNTPKFGIVVSKKIGNSVIRNKTKRLIREVIRKNILKFKSSYNYIFVARQGVENLNFNQINEIILKIINNSEVNV